MRIQRSDSHVADSRGANGRVRGNASVKWYRHLTGAGSYLR